MTLLSYWPLIVKGAITTFCAWAVAGCLSIFVGTLVGIITCCYAPSKMLSMSASVYVFVAKGIPAYVQILIAYFVIPAVFGINIPPFVAAVGALVFCSSGYVAEIVRSGINALSKGQWDACMVLGYSRYQALKRIIIPQAYTNVAPALVGELEQLLKSTSLLATIGISEITRTGMNIISRELNPLPVYMMIAVIYLCFSVLLALVAAYVRKKRL